MMMAYLRWGVAAAGVGVLVWFVVGSGLPGTTRGNAPAASGALASAAADTHTPSTNACPADAPVAPLHYTLKDADEAPVNLADFKGKVVLLDFWATWCGPCKVEIPGFIELQEKYGKDGFQVLGVSVDDTAEKLKPYVAEMKMNYPVLQGLGHDDMLDDFGPLLGIPVAVVISRDGKMCSRHTGLTSKEAFEEQIKALL